MESPALRGLLSFLEVPPAAGQTAPGSLPEVEKPGVDLPEAEPGVVSLPEVEPPETNLPQVEQEGRSLPQEAGAEPSSASREATPRVEKPGVDLPQVELPRADLPQVSLPQAEPAVRRRDSRPKLRSNVSYPVISASEVSAGTPIQLIRQVQDGLTRSEHAVYQVLWREGEPLNDHARRSQISLGELSRQTGLSRETMRYLVPSLVEKQVLRQLAPACPAANLPAIYEVASYARILARWKALGIIGFCKTGSSIHLVHDRPEPWGRETWGRSTSGRTVPGAGADLPEAEAGSQNKEENQVLEEDINSLMLLLDWLPEADEPFCRKILHECRSQLPDARPEEIESLCRAKLKGASIRSSATGYLLASVPPAIRKFRQSVRNPGQGREAVRPSSIDWNEIRAFVRKTMANPRAPEFDRKLAESWIADFGTELLEDSGQEPETGG